MAKVAPGPRCHFCERELRQEARFCVGCQTTMDQAAATQVELLRTAIDRSPTLFSSPRVYPRRGGALHGKRLG